MEAFLRCRCQRLLFHIVGCYAKTTLFIINGVVQIQLVILLILRGQQHAGLDITRCFQAGNLGHAVCINGKQRTGLIKLRRSGAGNKYHALIDNRCSGGHMAQIEGLQF